MNTNILILFCFLFVSASLEGQNVGIGTNSPDPSAILELSSTQSGLLTPRMTETEKNAIVSPATGLLIYQTDGNQGFYYYNGTTWVLVGGWSLTGNAGTTPGVGAGQNFLGTTDANDLILATNATNRLQISATGAVTMKGDFKNQDIIGNAIACTTNVASPVPGGAVAATSLGLPTNIGGTTTRSSSQPLSTTNDVANACVINGTTQSITITDGSGSDNSGVVIMGSVSIRTLNTASLPVANRFQIWLQRSTDNFVSDITNVWRTESAVACGLPASAPYNMSSGNTTVPIIFPDLNLSPGTYSYRLVFQGGNYGSGGGTVNYEALDRSLVILQVKR